MTSKKPLINPRIFAAKDLQQEMYKRFEDVDWDVYEEHELHYLKEKISLILDPSRMGNDNATNVFCPVIEKLYDTIVQEGTHDEKRTYMSFIFIFGLSDQDSDPKDKLCDTYDMKDDAENFLCWPVFRVPANTRTWNPIFIDLGCRVYKDWTDFKENNQLPPCTYCYPLRGKYTGNSCDKVLVEYANSPASSFSRKALHTADVASTGVGLGCAMVGIGAILSLPISGPVMMATTAAGVAASIYSGARAGATLVDRRAHKQNIDLADPEARNCWIAVAGSAAGTAAMGATANMVRVASAGQTVGRTTTAVVTTLNATSLAIGGVGTINGFFILRDKYNDDNLTTTDVLLFSSQLLLFCHATVNFRTAQAIVGNTQDKIINDFKDSLRSNRHRKAFTRLEKTTVSQLGSSEGRAQVIRSINHIGNKDEFMAAVVRTDKSMKYTRSRATFADGGKILVNKKLDINPEQLANANKQEKISLLRASQRYANNRLSTVNFRKLTEGILGNVSSETNMRNATRSFQSFSLKNIFDKKSENHELSTLATLLTTMDMKELEEFLSYIDVDFHELILKVSLRVFSELKLHLGSEFNLITFIVMDLLGYFVDGFLNAHRRLAVELSRHFFPRVPLKDMSKGEFCRAFLLHVLENPELICNIFYQTMNFVTLLIELWSFPQHIIIKKSFLVRDFIPVVDILLKSNHSIRTRIISLAIELFNILGLSKISSMILIVRELWLYYQDAIEKMSEKYDNLGDANALNFDDLCEIYGENILDMMSTDGIQSLIIRINKLEHTGEDYDDELEDEKEEMEEPLQKISVVNYKKNM